MSVLPKKIALSSPGDTHAAEAEPQKSVYRSECTGVFLGYTGSGSIEGRPSIEWSGFQEKREDVVLPKGRATAGDKVRRGVLVLPVTGVFSRILPRGSPIGSFPPAVLRVSIIVA